MKSASYLIVPVLCLTPLLQSCTTVPSSHGAYGVKSMLDVRHSGETPETYYALGRYYQAQSRHDNAAKAYERALALRSDYEEAANALAVAYAMQGRYDLAAERLQASIEQSPRAAYLHNNLGYVYYMQRRYTEAIDALQTAMRLEPGNARALRNLGLVHAATGGGGSSAALGVGNAPSALPDGTRMFDAPAVIGNVHQTPPLRPRTAATVGAHIDVVPIAPNIYELRAPPQAPAAAPASGRTLAKDSQPIRTFRLEISNGNGTTGMARRVAAALKRSGVNPVRLTNQKPWRRSSEIQYSEGYALEAAALARLLGQDALLIRNERLRRGINVRLVLGKDIHNETAFVRPPDSGAAMAFASARIGAVNATR